jgi:hypothetical protein
VGVVDPIKNDGIIKGMKHEVVAYLNRMGQLYYLARSVEEEGLIPRTSRFIIFRHKQAAHRGTDCPKKSDDSEELKHLNRVFSWQSVFIDRRLVFQYVSFDKSKNSLHFDLLEEHAEILKEAQDLLDVI